jgi:hypothetical protein
MDCWSSLATIDVVAGGVPILVKCGVFLEIYPKKENGRGF